MPLRESGEEYLKTIYLLRQANGDVRQCEIARAMGYSRASVCHMVQRLARQGYVTLAQNDVRLTASGAQTAREVYEKYAAAKRFLVLVLHVPEAAAEQDACRLAHALSAETVGAFQNQLARKGAAPKDADIEPCAEKGL